LQATGEEGTTTRHDFSELHDVWTRLALESDQADPFCSSDFWQLSFCETLAQQAIPTVEEAAGNIIAFSQLWFKGTLRMLLPLETDWCFGCPLLGRNAPELLAETIAYIRRQCGDFVFPDIAVSAVRPNSALLRELHAHLRRTHDFFLYSRGAQCSASLEGGLDGFLSRRSGNFRQKIKKSFRLARERGVEFERVLPLTPEEAKGTFDRLIAVELTSWKGLGHCGMAESPIRNFYEAMLRRLAEHGAGRVIFAKHEGADIGFIFGGKVGGIYRGQQFSYADDWKRHSIGNLMQIEKIRWLCEEGAERYDMGPIVGPKMEYKKLWTEMDHPIQTWMLRAKPGRVL
jgi:CelD/BcsL family acetyltransferase involved in cellulose biosynthesis